MKSVPAPISLAGSQLSETRHVCAFFNNDEEEYRVLLPFIKDGLKSGDKAVHVVNPKQREDHLQRLMAAGIDPEAAQQGGQLELRINSEVYLPDGRFDQDRMIEVFEQLASGNAPGGFPLSVGGVLQQNPFFVPPQEFLQEFRQRRASRGSRQATD